jgi:hypothetical protein
MATTIAPALHHCEGFHVLGPAGARATVDEVWLGADGEPQALALHTVAGERWLLFADDVRSVDLHARRLAVRNEARLLHLEPPRPSEEVQAALDPPHLRPAESDLHAFARFFSGLIAFLVVLATALIVLDFGVAWLVTGRAY